MCPSRGTLEAMLPETRYARTADGTHVAYQINGDGPIDIVLLRAWHSNLDHDWDDPVLAGVHRRLGAVGRVIRLDRRGTGLSDRFDPDALPTLEARVDDMRAVLDAAGSEQAVLIGLAHGAALCAVFAATYPERTAGLIVYSPPPLLLGQGDIEKLRTFGEALVDTWGTPDGQPWLELAAPTRAHDAAFRDWVRQDQAASGSGADAAALWRLVIETNIDGILPSIHVPTMVLWRRGSPHAGPYVAERIPGATAIELPGEDHIMISGDTRPWLAAVEAFVESVQGRDLDADRVLATVMFTDIVGSTDKATALGDRGWRELVDHHHAAIRRELARFRGREIDTAGDGFFAAFDGPARAIRCAAAVREAVAGLGLELRVGLHAGECERAGKGLRGLAIHIGARVAAAAAPGEVLVTSTVRDLVAGSGLAFEDAGRQSLKGVPEEWQLYRVASV
jgi:class 3 adenylate cyclase/alpha-beta hydrolase superfamily lysophospholipase